MYRDAEKLVKMSGQDFHDTQVAKRYLESKVDELSQLNQHCDELIYKLASLCEYLGYYNNSAVAESIPQQPNPDGQRDWMNFQINRLCERLTDITNKINKLEELL